jgi:hypothetical protein
MLFTKYYYMIAEGEYVRDIYCVQIQVRKSERERIIGEPALIWKGNIKEDLKYIECV